MSSDTTYTGTYNVSIELSVDRENDSEAEPMREYVAKLRQLTEDLYAKTGGALTAPPTVAVKWTYNTAEAADSEKAASPSAGSPAPVYASPSATTRRLGAGAY
jgi:hypothetical protein